MTLTVVTGPPCSGKSTYVRQHALPDDIVIDFDVLAQALGSPISHGHSDHIFKVTLEARHAAITEAIKWADGGGRVWIVDGSPPPGRRRQYLAHRARFVNMEASREELHARADAAGRPPTWHALIDQSLDGEHRVEVRTRW